MSNEKITDNMATMNMLMVMSEGNPGALNIIMSMMNSHRGFSDILLCDSLNIRGLRLYKLYSNCCAKNKEKFFRTLMMLRCGVYSHEQIQTNLNLFTPIPFIDDNIIIEGIPPYGEDFGPIDKKWEEFCNRNNISFTQKLNTIIEHRDNSSTPKK